MEAQIQDIIIATLADQGDGGASSSSTAFGPDTALIGRHSHLDSMGLVLLIVDVEQEIETRIGRKITPVSEKAMAARHSPFRTVASMAAYADELVKVSAS